MAGSPDTRRRRALAFMRSLAHHVPQERALVERALAQVGEDASVARAAELLRPGALWAQTSRGEAALARLRTAYHEALDFSRPAARAFAELDGALAEVDELLARPRPATAGPGGVADLMTGERHGATSRLEGDYLSALCYVVACLYGTSALAPLAGVSLGTSEGAAAARAAADGIAGHVAGVPELGCWTITRYLEGGVVLPVSEGFALDWSPATLDALDTANDLRRVSPFLSVTRSRGTGVVIAGRGNVVGTAPLDSILLRNAGVVTTLAPAALVGRPFDLANPVGSLVDALGGTAFCLSPEQLARALDRRARTHEARRWS